MHPDNRGGAGLNAYDVHKNLATIKQIGADSEAVHRATCLEMAPAGEMRDKQLLFNQGLIDRANGLLAPLCGKERMVSVACSHFTAGCRAAQAGVETPEESLRGKDTTTLNLLQLCEGDAVFMDLIKNGWEWTVLPYVCQETWPNPWE